MLPCGALFPPFSPVQNRTGYFSASFSHLRRSALQPFLQCTASVLARTCGEKILLRCSEVLPVYPGLDSTEGITECAGVGFRCEALPPDFLWLGSGTIHYQLTTVLDAHTVHKHNALIGIALHAAVVNGVERAVGHGDGHIVSCAHDFSALLKVFLQDGIVVGLAERSQGITGCGITYGIVPALLTVGAIHHIIESIMLEDVASLCPSAVGFSMCGTSAFPFCLFVAQIGGWLQQ